MEKEERNLNCLDFGKSATIKRLEYDGRRFLDLGLICGGEITKLFASPFGDPCAFLVRGAVIALRKSDCKNIIIY